MALKVQLKDLLLKRENIEGDIALRVERLEASGVGRTCSLVDKEGFPRADVDIASIRTDRRRLTGTICACCMTLLQQSCYVVTKFRVAYMQS